MPSQYSNYTHYEIALRLLNFCFSPMPRLRRKAFELFESTITTRRKEREEIGDNKPVGPKFHLLAQSDDQ